MAKNDMIANHKRGFINSTVGNAFRGGLVGALVIGGGAALVAMTAGLALPLVLGAAAGGAALFGGLNALGGAIRWGAETVGGIIGINRKQRGPAADEFGHEPQQSQGLGLAETLTAAVGAALGLKSMKNKLSNAFGKSEREEMDGFDFGPDATRAQRRAGAAPRIPALLESKAQMNEVGEVEFQLNREDLANPKMREALANFGKAQIQHRNELHKNGGIEGKREAVRLQRAAMSIGEDGGVDESLKPSFNRETGVFTVRSEHLMNTDTQYTMVTEGRKHERSVRQAQKMEERELNRELSSLSEPPLFRRTEDTFRDASQPQKEEAAEVAPTVKREDTPATQAFAENVRKLAQDAAAGREEAGQDKPATNLAANPELKEKMGKAAEEVREAGASLASSGAEARGAAENVRSGAASGQSAQQDRQHSR